MFPSRRHVAKAVAALFAVVTVAGVLVTPARPATAAAAVGAGFSPGGGFIYLSDADLARDLDDMAATGAKWVRIDFPWSVTEQSPGVFTWSRLDRVVNAATNRGLQVIGLLAYSPEWARPAGTDMMHPPTEPADFANFAAVAVRRYSATVKVWEIWNEPNISQFWKPQPSAPTYAALLKRAYAAVRGADPSATVLSAGLSPAVDAVDGSQISPITFLRQLYANGAGGSFDAVGMHPYSYPAMPMDPTTSAWNTFYRLPLVYDVMVQHGDGAKKIWSTEFGAPTGTSASAVSETTGSAIITEAYAAIAAWPWAGPLLVYSNRDSGTDPADGEQNFGLRRQDFSPKLALTAFLEAVGTTPTTTTPAATTVTPSGVTPIAGAIVGGNAASLASDDDIYLQNKSTSQRTAATGWYGSFSSVPKDVTSLRITYRGSNSRACSQVISVYDWVGGAWTTLDTRSVGSTEVQVSDLVPSGLPSRYVGGSAATGEVRVSVTCRTTNPFTSNGDVLRLTYGR